jgi:peptidoglycan/LPS O-acetylase OafA/YrhL
MDTTKTIALVAIVLVLGVFGAIVVMSKQKANPGTQQVAPATGSVNWLQSLADGQKKAKEANRPLLVKVGSSW